MAFISRLFGLVRSTGFCLSLILALAACGGRLPEVDSLRIERDSWDTLRVELLFASQTSGTGEPEFTRVTLFDSAYDTLYTGPDSRVPVHDGKLGSSEPILVEACGLFRGGAVCEQRAIQASPKRAAAELEVGFPLDAEMTRGSYELAPKMERMRFDSTGWEPIRADFSNPMNARIRVLDTDHAGLTVPVKTGTGRFDVSQSEGYRDFRFYLRSAFRENDRARLEFTVAADYPTGALQLGSTVVAVTQKTEEEQAADVSRLAESAGRELLDRLGAGQAGRALVFVNSWEYEAADRRYRCEIELHWRSRTSRIWHETRLSLRVGDDGSEAVLELLDANSPARRMWEGRLEGRSVSLGTLQQGVTLPEGESRRRGW